MSDHPTSQDEQLREVLTKLCWVVNPAGIDDVQQAMDYITTHYTPKTEQEDTGFVDNHGTKLKVGDKVHVTNPCGQCKSEDSGYGRSPWGQGCAYKWDTDWQLCFGLYWDRDEFTTLSHNGKTARIGFYLKRFDATSEHFVISNPWITETYGEII